MNAADLVQVRQKIATLAGVLTDAQGAIDQARATLDRLETQIDRIIAAAERAAPTNAEARIRAAARENGWKVFPWGDRDAAFIRQDVTVGVWFSQTGSLMDARRTDSSPPLGSQRQQTLLTEGVLAWLAAEPVADAVPAEVTP